MIRYNLHPAAAASWLVHVAFATPDDLYRHLRMGQGFYLPARAVPSEAGARVILEIGVAGAAHATLLHGQVRAWDGAGIWLDLPCAGAAARFRPEATRRRHRRFGSDLFVEVSHGGGQPWMCRAIDLSPDGLRLSASALELGVTNDEIRVTLLAPDRELATARARIAWASGRSAGLELIGESPGLTPVLASLEARWAAVEPVVHDASCPCAVPVKPFTSPERPAEHRSPAASASPTGGCSATTPSG